MNKCLLAVVLSLTIAMLVSCTPPPYTCLDPLGCLELQSGDPLVIGAILATSGSDGTSGLQALENIETAVADQDMLFGHSLKLYRFGTDCSPSSARQAATEFATYPELVAVLGPSCAEEQTVAESILFAAGIPLLGPIPDPSRAVTLAVKLLTAIEEVSVQGGQGVLIIPRQALFDALNLSR